MLFLTKKEVMDKIGPFDRDYYLYYEEIDYCLRAKKNGWKIFFYPGTEAIHLGGESAKKLGRITSSGKQLERLKMQSEFIYFRKNYGILYVFLDFIFILMLNTIALSKIVTSKDKNRKLSEISNVIKSSFNILISTKFGLISND